MHELKIFLSNYSLIIDIIIILFACGVAISFLFYNRKVYAVQRVFVLIFFVIIGSIIKPILLKTFPLYKKGECFRYEKVIHGKPTEKWHSSFLKKELEFLVLKVGKESYYVSTTEPKLEDFPIKEDGKTKKSDCSTIFAR